MSWDCWMSILKTTVLILTIIGFVYAAYRRYRDRIKFEINILEEDDRSALGHNPGLQSITFEITNKSSKINALKRKMYLEGYIPDGRKVSMVFEVMPNVREVPSFTPKTFKAFPDKLHGNFSSLLYRSYKFEFLRSPAQVIFADTINGERLTKKEYRAGLKTFKKEIKAEEKK